MLIFPRVLFYSFPLYFDFHKGSGSSRAFIGASSLFERYLQRVSEVPAARLEGICSMFEGLSQRIWRVLEAGLGCSQHDSEVSTAVLEVPAESLKGIRSGSVEQPQGVYRIHAPCLELACSCLRGTTQGLFKECLRGVPEFPVVYFRCSKQRVLRVPLMCSYGRPQ